MGTRTAGTGHATAVRRARQVAAHRAELLREHEELVASTLVEYFEAKDRADQIREAARSRAARLVLAAEQKAKKLAEQAAKAGQELTEQAEKDAADDDAQVGQAVRHLRELGESVASVAEMTSLSQAVVRAVEREHPAPREPNLRARRRASASKPRESPDTVPE